MSRSMKEHMVCDDSGIRWKTSSSEYGSFQDPVVPSRFEVSRADRPSYLNTQTPNIYRGEEWEEMPRDCDLLTSYGSHNKFPPLGTRPSMNKSDVPRYCWNQSHPPGNMYDRLLPYNNVKYSNAQNFPNAPDIYSYSHQPIVFQQKYMSATPRKLILGPYRPPQRYY